MKQVLQSYRDGSTEVREVPAPRERAGEVLVQTVRSVISAGTERAVVEVSSKSLLGKARARPDLVARTLEKARREGIAATVQAVRSRLDAAAPLGYSAAGYVLAVGEGVSDYRQGDLVACAGAGYANHAEVNAVPRNLCARVPDGVSPEQAAFTTLGAIALQGVRVTEPQIGEVVVVVGLGLIGQLTVQVLRAAGCRVIGLDLDAGRADLALTLGAEAATTSDEHAAQIVQEITAGAGADAVVLTAATRSSQPVSLAAELCREKGRVVAVGDVGLNVPRPPFYMKELELRLSRSYGPGRYDASYEEGGRDYPYAYVRWTEQRNMAAFLQLLATGSVRVEPLITHRFPIDQAADAYAVVTGRPAPASSSEPAEAPGAAEHGPGRPAADRGGAATGEASTKPLAIVLEFSARPEELLGRRVAVSRMHGGGMARTSTAVARPAARSGAVRVGTIGAGNFARSVLLPRMRRMEGVELAVVATARGSSARHVAGAFGFAHAASDAALVIGDDGVDAVVIATRHDVHAELAAAALRAGKAVFVEKPLGITAPQLRAVLAAQRETGGTLMVGLNRRFAPHTVEARRALEGRRGRAVFTCRVNGGPLPADSWVRDPAQGGGRIVSEGCHFTDLLQYLIGAPPVDVTASGFASAGADDLDNVSAVVTFADGSVGALHYVSADAGAAVGKERVEGFAEGGSFAIDDFKSGRYACGARSWTKRVGFMAQDKGHTAELRAFFDSVRRGAPSPIDPYEAALASLVTFKIIESARSGARVPVDAAELAELTDGGADPD